MVLFQIIYMSLHLGAAVAELCDIHEDLHYRIFIAEFLKLQDSGAQATSKRLLVTHTETPHEAFRNE
jgi:hypothetical protein